MGYYAKALATNSSQSSDFTNEIRRIRDNESQVRNPEARKMIKMLMQQKQEIILKTSEKLSALQKQLEADPLMEDQKTQLMVKNLQRHLDKAYSYATK
ncbi:MAG: hypothetical protein HFJ42_02880 [Clostridia bacterium]|nr:hypothetical protein [Clostridia bacterium]